MQQHGKKYRNIPYNGKDLNHSGCAIVAMANAYRCLTGIKLDVNDLVKLSNDTNCAVPNIGTRWRYIFEFAKKYDLDVNISHDPNETMTAIQNGAVAIVSAHAKNKKIFTLGGHWMVLADVIKNGFLIYDSKLSAKKYRKENARSAIKGGQLKILKRSVLVDAKLLAGEIKPEFPEPNDCESFENTPFGAAILRIKQ